MAIAEAPAAEVAQPSADAAAAGPSTSPSSTPPQESTPKDTATADAVAQASSDDPYAKVTELDFDEIVKRHPRAGKRLEALATKKALTLQEQRDAETRTKAEQEQKAKARELWRKWNTDKDSDAGVALIDLLGAPLEQEISEEAYADKVQAARTAAKQEIWEQHAKSFGLDPSDDDVAEVIKESKDFKSLNTALVRLAKDSDAVGAMWEHPEIQKRHTAALNEARQAATLNGQASVMGERKLDAATSGGGRPQSADEVIAEYAAVFSRGQRPSKELTDAYRKATGRE